MSKHETCLTCKQEFPDKSTLMKHKWADHKNTINPRKSAKKQLKTQTKTTTDPLDRVIQFQADVTAAIVDANEKMLALHNETKACQTRLDKLNTLAVNLGIPKLDEERDYTKEPLRKQTEYA